MGNDFARMIAEMADGDEPAPLSEAVVDELQAIYRDYQRSCPFQPGDLVTPRKGRNISGAGQPHIVLEVFDEPIRWVAGASAGSNSAYARMDMRVACRARGEYAPFMCESWMFEPWPVKD